MATRGRNINKQHPHPTSVVVNSHIYSKIFSILTLYHFKINHRLENSWYNIRRKEGMKMPMICNPEIQTHGRPRQLDYGMCFRLWLELGTVRKVLHVFEREGILKENKDGTTEPFSQDAIRRAAWLWVIWHPEESLKIWQSFGYFLNGRDDEWKEWMIKKIRKHADTPNLFEKALRVNGMMKWYNERR